MLSPGGGGVWAGAALGVPWLALPRCCRAPVPALRRGFEAGYSPSVQLSVTCNSLKVSSGHTGGPQSPRGNTVRSSFIVSVSPYLLSDLF